MRLWTMILDWSAIMALSVPIAELIVRGTITYLVLVALVRVVGQRESGGLGLTDLLVIVLVAQAAGPGLMGDSATVGDGIVLVATILAWSVVLDAVAYRWPRIGRLLKARPKGLVDEGRLNRHTMRRELMSDDEVMSQLRLHGIEDVSVVERAFIEPNGRVSVILRESVVEDEGEPPVP